MSLVSFVIELVRKQIVVSATMDLSETLLQVWCNGRPFAHNTYRTRSYYIYSAFNIDLVTAIIRLLK